MSQSRPNLIARFFTLCLAAAMVGCAAEIPSTEELAKLESEGAYSDEVAAAEQPLAAASRSTGFVWANNAGAAIGTAYTPASGYWYNYKGGTNTVTHLGTGRYRVTMPSLTLPGNAQVVAYGMGDQRCSLSARPSSSNGAVQLSVHCHSARGVLTDSQFVAFYSNHEETVSAEQAYGVGDYESGLGGPTVTRRDYQFVSEISRQSPGYYQVVLNGGMGHGTALATAISTNGTFCSVSNYYVLGGRFYVHCYDNGGASVDTDFSFMYLKEASFFGLDNASARTASTADHTANGFYSYQGADNVYFDWDGWSPNLHRVEFNNLANIAFPTTALVTYEGNGAFWCKPSSWGHSGAQMNLYVHCFDTTGAKRSVRYSAFGAWKQTVNATLLKFE